MWVIKMTAGSRNTRKDLKKLLIEKVGTIKMPIHIVD